MINLSLPLSELSMHEGISVFPLFDKKTVFELNKKHATLMSACSFEGVGVHSGKIITMNVLPASVGTGIVFIRGDLDVSNVVEARFDCVTDTRMSTTISNVKGVSVSTIEHIMAAFMGLGITNAYVELSGPEVPIMDGSSVAFIKAFQKSGVKFQDERQHVFIVQRPIRVESSTGFAEFVPSVRRTFNVYYDFCGRFRDTPYECGFQFDMDNDCFAKLISDARTFGLYEDGVRLQQMGYAKGASLDNTIILKDMQVINDGGLRSSNEFVRHKILDAMGDISLASCAILGAYIAHNPSHDLNNKLLKALFLN